MLFPSSDRNGTGNIRDMFLFLSMVPWSEPIRAAVPVPLPCLPSEVPMTIPTTGMMDPTPSGPASDPLPVIAVPRSSTPYARGKRPLLRGILVDLGRWVDCHDRPGIQARYATIAVWCPFCSRWHYHGWDPADDGRHAFHRGAHCHDPKSPFDATGYYISTVRFTDPGYASHVTIPGRAILRRKPKRWPVGARTSASRRPGCGSVGRVEKPAAVVERRLAGSTCSAGRLVATDGKL